MKNDAVRRFFPYAVLLYKRESVTFCLLMPFFWRPANSTTCASITQSPSFHKVFPFINQILRRTHMQKTTVIAPLELPPRGGEDGILFVSGLRGLDVTLHTNVHGSPEDVRRALRMATIRRRSMLFTAPSTVLANVIYQLRLHTVDTLEVFGGREHINAAWRYEIKFCGATGESLGPNSHMAPTLLLVHELTGEVIHDGPLNAFLGREIRRRTYVPRGKRRSDKQRGLAESPDGTIYIKPEDEAYTDMAQFGNTMKSQPDTWPIDEYTGERYIEFPTMADRLQRFRENGFTPYKPGQAEAIRKWSARMIREAQARLAEVADVGILAGDDAAAHEEEDRLKQLNRERRRRASAKGRVLRLDFSHAFTDQEDPDSEDARAFDDAVRQ